MAKYELSDGQVKQLRSILANAQIRGADAPTIIILDRALKTPIVEKREGKEK